MIVSFLNFGQEPPSGSTVGNVNSGRVAFIHSRVELSDDAGLAAYHIPNEGARVSSGREGFDGLVVARVVDGKLPGHDAKVFSSVGLQSGVAPDSETGGVTVLSNGKTTPALGVDLGRD